MYGQKSLIIIINLPFSEWRKIVTNGRFATAAIERIVHSVHLIDTGSKEQTKENF